jgi:hypothetical protein
MDPITKDFVRAIERFCQDEGVDLISFQKGHRKDDVAHEYLEAFEGKEGVLFVGKAQEKTTTFRTEKRTNPSSYFPYNARLYQSPARPCPQGRPGIPPPSVGFLRPTCSWRPATPPQFPVAILIQIQIPGDQFRHQRLRNECIGVV